MNDKISKITINSHYTIQETLKKMDEVNFRLLIVVDNMKFTGLVSIGDIQRAIIANYSIDIEISKIMRKNIEVAYKSDNLESIKQNMLETRTEYMPILDLNNELVDVIFWEDLFPKQTKINSKLNLPVVIMAGGKGTRMKPLTNVIPKPLIPLDDKTIVENIIDKFRNVGCDKFYLSVNYKSDMIEHYFNNLNKDYFVNYIHEDTPLGTAGSLHLLNDSISTTFFISNCDILINDDYSEIYKYHKKYNNELTVVGSFRHYSIPYGTLETSEEGRLVNITEKPNLSYLINSGMYILEPHLIKEIPKNRFFHITDLITNIIKRGGRVGVFPVSEKSWIDIGEWDKYLDNIKVKH